jgi:hypothetical protein
VTRRRAKAKAPRLFDIRAIEPLIGMPIGTARDRIHHDVFEAATGFPAGRLAWLCKTGSSQPNSQPFMIDAFDADSIAVHMGMHPSQIWSTWWDLAPEELAA